MALAYAARGESGKREAFFVSAQCHPQTIAVVQTRARPLGIEVVVGNHASAAIDAKFSARWSSTRRRTERFLTTARSWQTVHAAGALAIVAADPLALCLLKPPGEFGADVGRGQHANVSAWPLGYGGPHAGVFSR